MNKRDILIVCALEQETPDYNHRKGQLEGYDILYTGVGKIKRYI